MKDGELMKKISKTFIFLILIFLLISIFNITYAFDPNTYQPTELTNSVDSKVVFDKAGVILGAIRNISAVVAVISLMIIGLKYILGSAEEKANYKATLVPYVIGCVLAVAGTTLVTFIYNAVK